MGPPQLQRHPSAAGGASARRDGGQAVTDQPPGPDRVVTRINDIATTALDILGALLLAAGSGYAVFLLFGIPAGLCLAGLVVMLLSSFAQRRAAGPKSKAKPARTRPPGPRDPGTVHIAGGE
jgi:hypothetical protein